MSKLAPDQINKFEKRKARLWSVDCGPWTAS
jgi:hypothetical protein